MSASVLRGPDLSLTVPGGTGLAVYVDGQDAADTTLVLVHGWSGCADAWSAQVDLLANNKVRLIRYDQRGHGATPLGHEPIGIGLLAEDLARVVDTMAPYGRVVLAGHSMGGMVITALAAARPELFGERICGVLLASTCGRTVRRPLGHGLGRLTRARCQPVVWSDQLTTRLRLGVLACFGMGLGSLPMSLVTAYWRLLTRHDQSGALWVLARAKVLILVGEKDRITPVYAARDLESQIPGARLFITPDTGHSLPQCRAAVVARLLGELLHGGHAVRPDARNDDVGLMPAAPVDEGAARPGAGQCQRPGPMAAA
jgi:pimeloyl-ACP methyl ester carboxylesterase